MKKLLFAIVVVGIFSNVCEARGRKKYYTTTSYSYSSVDNTSAQGVANAMAERNYVGHFGGHSSYEGCGSGFTQDQAYNNCCFANSGMATIDVGYAQSNSGMWYCCRRYVR